MTKSNIFWAITSIIIMTSLFFLDWHMHGLLSAIVLIGAIIIISIIFVFIQHVWFNKQKKDEQTRLIKILQLGYIILFATLLIGKILPELIFKILIFVSLSMVLLGIAIKHDMPKTKSNKKMSLENKIKTDLNIKTHTVKKKFPKFLNWVGGFVIPGIPIFSMVNKGWKKKLSKEAIIHENIHLYYLQNGGLIVYLISTIVLSAIFTEWLGINYNFVIVPYTIFMFVFFEYITFRKTNYYGMLYGIETRKWNAKLFFKYLVVYSIQISIIATAWFFVNKWFGW